MYWIGSTVVINLGRSFLHPSHFSQDEYFNRYLFQLGVAPTAANKVRKGFSTHHVVSLDPLVAKAQMMKFKPLDDCEVHGVWVGLPAFAASRRPSHQTSGICAYHQARNSKLVVSEEFAICGMFIQVGHAKMHETWWARTNSLDLCMTIRVGWVLGSGVSISILLRPQWNQWRMWRSLARSEIVDGNGHCFSGTVSLGINWVINWSVQVGIVSLSHVFFPFKQLQWLAQADDTSGFASALRIAPPLRHRGAMSQSTGQRPIIFLRTYQPNCGLFSLGIYIFLYNQFKMKFK